MMSHQDNLYWGDFHCHLEDTENAARYLEEARRHLDFYPVLCYPFVWETHRGLRVESVRARPEFHKWWRNLQHAVRRFHAPGRFVTFLGYEWCGNRTAFGDHNVFYLEDDKPLDGSWNLNTLCRHLRQNRGIAIPHHAGYLSGQRGKNWDYHDDALSPIVEIFSMHGSSEGTETPLPLRGNGSMGPRVTGGTWQDGLARGYRLGCIASGDGPGLAGRWGTGLAGVWAQELTRASLWEAIMARRTYAVTGDRIRLWFSANGHPMGSIMPHSREIAFKAQIEGLHAIDRVELIRNGEVLDTYYGHATRRRIPSGKIRFKVRIEAGWGPATYYGFPAGASAWALRLQVRHGRIISHQPCFSLLEQRIESCDRQICDWRLRIPFRTDSESWQKFCQSVVFEIEGTSRTTLLLTADGHKFVLRAEDIFARSNLFPLLEESRRRIFRTFRLKAADIPNPDIYYQNARKVKIHCAIPERDYKLDVCFTDANVPRGRNYYYVRVTQTNGQMAWSSPIWTG